MLDNSLDIPCFIINLEQDLDRKEHMASNCSILKSPVKFINAVDGRKISSHDLDLFYDERNTIKALGRKLAKGEIGCALSHQKIYHKIVSENIDIALILEDDIVFLNGLITILQSLKKFPANWEVILLGHHVAGARDIDTPYYFFDKKPISPDFFLARPSELACGTYGYLINTNGATKLLKYLEQLDKPIDHYTGNTKLINVYCIYPSLIKISDEYNNVSDIMQERSDLYREIEFSNKNRTPSLKKRITVFLGIYSILKNIKLFINRNMIFLKRLNPFI